jgi:hypothetical protein
MEMKIKMSGKELNEALKMYMGCDCYLERIEVDHGHNVKDFLEYEKVDDITLHIEGFK